VSVVAVWAVMPSSANAAVDRLAELRFLQRRQPIQHLHHRDATAETGEQLAQLQADGVAAHHQRGLAGKQRGQVDRTGVGIEAGERLMAATWRASAAASSALLGTHPVFT
jgi:hypothetical protein